MSNLLVVPASDDALSFLQKLLNKLTLLKDVSVVSEDEKRKIPKSKFKSKKHFLEGFGMFKSHPVSFEIIRKNAWKNK